MVLDSLLKLGTKLVDKLIPDPEAKAAAQLELAKLAQNGELASMANETELFKLEQSSLTDRHKADMSSDSTLSKNIRPATLVFILTVYTIFGLMSAFEIEVNPNYVELLGQWGMLIMSFYFGGRTLEKIVDMRSK
jgi:Holin of 3TMs, for gene-transfer release